MIESGFFLRSMCKMAFARRNSSEDSVFFKIRTKINSSRLHLAGLFYGMYIYRLYTETTDF